MALPKARKQTGFGRGEKQGTGKGKGGRRNRVTSVVRKGMGGEQKRKHKTKIPTH